MRTVTARSPLSGVAEQILKSAQEILQLSHKVAEIPSAVNNFLTTFLVWPYTAGPISIQELGTDDAVFQSAIYTSATKETREGIAPMTASRVACIFHIAHTLTVDELRTGHRRIGAAKRLKRPAPTAVGYPVHDTPLGVVFCIDSARPLEKVAEDMMELNKTAPSTEWPDMVVVLQRGTVNYAVQIEGDKIRADFLLPNTADFPVMPMYVHVFARALGLHSLNRLSSFLFLHLQAFSPGVKLPNEDAVQGISTMGMTLGAYQFNLKRQLVPVPDDMRTDKGAGLRNLPFRIESREGELLSHVQFIPWQEGGAIRVIGKMPLESVLVFLGPVMKGAQVIQQENARISSVLPISRFDFLNSLQKLQAQSNMIVKPEQPKWIVSKIADEGSSSPFVARLFIGVTQLRNQVFFDEKDRDAFDKPYESTLNALLDARATANDILRLVRDHRLKVSRGEAARLAGKTIHVDGVHKELRKHTSDFLTSAGRSLKQGMQSVAKALGIDIGFFFKNQNAFEKGLASISSSHAELADYLRAARTWAEKLNLMRNKVEHEGWILPRVGYRESGGKIEMMEPHVEGEPVSEFVGCTLDRLCCFVEEVTVYGLRVKMDSALSVAEMPLSERDPSVPQRFRLALALGGTRLWKLVYHASSFEQV
jgi:hypothetical protein